MQTAALSASPAVTHRTAAATVTVLGPDGAPLAGRPVTVEQVRHDLGFGNIGFDFIELANGETEAGPRVFGGARPELAEHLSALWLDLHNHVTLPFYWRMFEPSQGRPATRRLHAAAAWFRERGVVVKGHPLLWHTQAPTWLTEVPPDEVLVLVQDRIRREVGDFADVIDIWDAINEPVIMPVFTAEQNGITPLAQRLGRVETVRLAFDTARAAGATTLVLNDFDMSPAYEQLITECLDAGIQIDAIGLQSHMHQGWWGEEKTAGVLDRFSRFGLPLHFSETTLLSGDLMPRAITDLNDYQVPSWPSTPEGEARQADEIVRHYTRLVEHPAVQVITYWGLSDDGSWLGAPSGLVRADGTPKPAFHALRELIKGDWWLDPVTVLSDEQGQVSVAGFRGSYRLTADGLSAVVHLGDGDLVDRTAALA